MLGIYLIIWGNDTVERVLGVGLVTMPAVLALMWTGTWAWVFWKLLRARRPRTR